VLSFLGTAYFDDVATSRPRYDERDITLVAHLGATLVGILDLTLPDEQAGTATIETVAVHPDHQRVGVGSALLGAAAARAAGTCAQVEAWTRDDEVTLRWYRRRGFAEDSHYLHVYKDWDEPADGFDGLRLVKGLLHCTDLGREAELRRRFRRVHVCRRMAVATADLR